MATGTVKWYDNSRGKGFIAPDDGGEDVFVRYPGINGSTYSRSLEAGQRVSYELKLSDLAPEAVNVTAI